MGVCVPVPRPVLTANRPSPARLRSDLNFLEAQRCHSYSDCLTSWPLGSLSRHDGRTHIKDTLIRPRAIISREPSFPPCTRAHVQADRAMIHHADHDCTSCEYYYIHTYVRIGTEYVVEAPSALSSPRHPRHTHSTTPVSSCCWRHASMLRLLRLVVTSPQALAARDSHSSSRAAQWQKSDSQSLIHFHDQAIDTPR